MEMPREAYEALEREIASDESPVGIDAKKTHVLILHHLERIEERLARLEARLDATGGPTGASPGTAGAGADPER